MNELVAIPIASLLVFMTIIGFMHHDAQTSREAYYQCVKDNAHRSAPEAAQLCKRP